jgi:hypothetical protein
VKGDLQKNVGSFAGISQSDILMKYLQLQKRDDGLARTEDTFYKKVWPQMEEQRKRDKTIQTFERMHFGKEVPVWQLK